MSFAKFLRTSFHRIPLVAASQLCFREEAPLQVFDRVLNTPQHIILFYEIIYVFMTQSGRITSLRKTFLRMVMSTMCG